MYKPKHPYKYPGQEPMDSDVEGYTMWFVVVFRPLIDPNKWETKRTAKVLGCIVATKKEAMGKAQYIFSNKWEKANGDQWQGAAIKFNYPYLSAWDDWVCIPLATFVEQITEPQGAMPVGNEMIPKLNVFPGLQKLCNLYEPCPF